MISFEFPLKTISLTNVRLHWSKKAKIAKDQRKKVWAMWLQNVKAPVLLPCVVTITRIAPRAYDDDNLRGAAKSIRDEIAKMLGVDDRDPKIEWRYFQERGKPRYYGVRITIS